MGRSATVGRARTVGTAQSTTRSESQSVSEGVSTTEGSSFTEGTSESEGTNASEGVNATRGTSQSSTAGQGRSVGWSAQGSVGGGGRGFRHWADTTETPTLTDMSYSEGADTNSSRADGSSESQGTSASRGTSSARGRSAARTSSRAETLSTSRSKTTGISQGVTESIAATESLSEGESSSRATGTGETRGDSRGESLQESLEPIYENLPGSVHSLENVRDMAAQALRNLTTGRAAVNFVGATGMRTASLSVANVESYALPEEQFDELRSRVLGCQPLRVANRPGPRARRRAPTHADRSGRPRADRRRTGHARGISNQEDARCEVVVSAVVCTVSGKRRDAPPVKGGQRPSPPAIETLDRGASAASVHPCKRPTGRTGMRRKTILNSAMTALALWVTAAMTINLKDDGINLRSNPSVQGSAPSTEDAWHGRGSRDDSSYAGDAYSFDGNTEPEPGPPGGLERRHQQRPEPGPKRR